MKEGTYLRLAYETGEHSRAPSEARFVSLGTSTDEIYAERDALRDVQQGKASTVYIVKVIAVAERTARILNRKEGGK